MDLVSHVLVNVNIITTYYSGQKFNEEDESNMEITRFGEKVDKSDMPTAVKANWALPAEATEAQIKKLEKKANRLAYSGVSFG